MLDFRVNDLLFAFNFRRKSLTFWYFSRLI